MSSDEILELLQQADQPLSPAEIAERTGGAPRTLRRWLNKLVSQGVVQVTGRGPARQYQAASPPNVDEHLQRPVHERPHATWEPAFLYDYRPNETFYLDEQSRVALREIGAPTSTLPAGTYARRILDRLLIDLSWNSSRLEGNTYSLLDTEELLLRGQEPEGKSSLETQMVLNHKGAIEFLVENAADLVFTPLLIRTLHALLAENLLADPAARGRLRRIPVQIHGSTFIPLANPQRVEDAFLRLTQTAEVIKDPFEASLFVLVQTPYLQPFVDVNKRVSRLAANIPFIRENYFPLSFLDIPRDEYLRAVLAVYELRDVRPFAELFVRAYARSAEKYAVIAQSLGDPDPVRLRLRSELKATVAHIVRGRVLDPNVPVIVEELGLEVPRDLLDAFGRIVREELAALHEASLASFRLRPSEFEAWKAATSSS